MEIHDLADLLLFSSVILGISTLTFAVLWVRARERVLRTKLDARQLPDAPHDRIEHLVTAVEAMAIEVERISEAQRFTAQVLVDRSDKAPAAPKRVPERIITPH